MSSGESTSHRRHRKKHHRRHHKRSRSRESSQLTSLLQSLRGEVAESHSGLREELEKISSRVTVIEEQRLTEPSSQEQSLPTASLWTTTVEQSSNTPSNTAEQSLLIANPRPLGQSPPNNRDRADGAEPHNRSESPLPASEETLEWGDRDDVPDYDEVVYWEPSDSDSPEGDTRKISATTAKIVKDAFSQMLLPKKRKSIKRKQPLPDTPFTKVPKLDPTIQSRMTPAAKTVDRNLAGLQGCVLDAAIPLVNMLESARTGTLNPKEAAESAQQALKFVGNASAHLSTERRRKASLCLNRELSTLVEDETTFHDAAPLLFGSSFQQKMKDHMEALRNLKQSSSASYSHGRQQQQSFRRSHPPQSRGGGNSRGRGQRNPKKTGK